MFRKMEGRRRWGQNSKLVVTCGVYTHMYMYVHVWCTCVCEWFTKSISRDSSSIIIREVESTNCRDRRHVVTWGPSTDNLVLLCITRVNVCIGKGKLRVPRPRNIEISDSSSPSPTMSQPRVSYLSTYLLTYLLT